MFNSKKFREDYELKQDEFATLIESTQSNVSRIENSGLNLNKRQYKILCEKYGKDVIDKYISEDFSLMSSGNVLVNQELLKIIKSQNATIIALTASLQEQNQRMNDINERLLTILENVGNA